MKPPGINKKPEGKQSYPSTTFPAFVPARGLF